MKQSKTDILIFIGIVIFALLVLLSTIGQSTINIQFYDTYFVIDKMSITVLIIGSLTFLIFLARGLTRKFKATGTNIGLIIGLTLLALITYQFILIQQSYLNETMRLDDVQFPNRGQFIVDVRNKINWTWGLFGFWIMGLILLIFRTVKISMEDHSKQMFHE